MTNETRKLKTGTLHRAATFERASVDEQARTVELAFSSEAPVARWFGAEVLDHSPASIRMDRIRNSGPVLLDHDTSRHIGVVQSVEIGQDRVGRAVVDAGGVAGGDAAVRAEGGLEAGEALHRGAGSRRLVGGGQADAELVEEVNVEHLVPLRRRVCR